MTIEKNVDLSEILWYKIGGTAKYFIECQNKQDLLEAFTFIQKEKIKRYFVVGMGANLLFTDDYFDGAVIHITANTSTQITVKGTQVISYSGELLDTVIKTSFENNLIGLEWAGGLPSTVGAAIRGNVGAFGHSIRESVKEVEVLKLSDNGYTTSVLDNESLNFSYRDSLVKQNKNLIVLSATFELKQATSEEIKTAKEIYKQNIEYRKTHHPDPKVYPNTGSTFKNIRGEEVEKVFSKWPDVKKLSDEKWHGKVAVGYINNKLGFSNFKIGGAQVSEMHNNFINNVEHAKAIDVEAIIRTIQKKYQEMFGFMPEPEIEIVH
jgi:UDP-N-acetylmuramate dehydrogenase